MRLLRAFLLIAILPLAACDAIGAGTFGASDTSEPVRKVPLFGGEVVVSGPVGYCIDPTSLRRRGGGHVILLASCAGLTGQPAMTVDPAVMTVSVLPADRDARQPTADELAASMRPARVLERIDGDGVSFVHLASGGEVGVPGGDPAHWRGAMLINGHLTGLALYAPEGSRVARGQTGQALMIALAERLRSGSPERRAATPPEAPEEGINTPAAKGEGGFNILDIFRKKS